MSLPPLFVSSEIYRAAGYPPSHPLGIQRIGAVLELCEALGWLAPGGYVDSPRATFQQLTKFHEPAYVEALIAADAAGKIGIADRKRFNLGVMENPLFEGLYERASTSVGGSIYAAELAMDGRVVYHPSGGTHHGRPDRASGFCYFNDPVFAILTFLDAGLQRVLYVDLDAHHGDGVEDAFRDKRDVLTMSIHEADRWPHTGAAREMGEDGIFNLPVAAGLRDAEFLGLVETLMAPVAEAFAPEAVVITCGADALAGDPLSRLELGNVALWTAVERFTAMSGRAVVLGGGGYNPWTVARCWAGLWGRIIGAEIPATLPERARATLRALSSELIDEDEVDPAWITTIADA